jgi:hypothetical protein
MYINIMVEQASEKHSHPKREKSKKKGIRSPIKLFPQTH